MRMIALEGQASALQQAGRWAEAIGVWKQVLAQIPEEQQANREDVQEQIAHCSNRLTPPPPVVHSQSKPVASTRRTSKPPTRSAKNRNKHFQSHRKR